MRQGKLREVMQLTLESGRAQVPIQSTHYALHDSDEVIGMYVGALHNNIPTCIGRLRHWTEVCCLEAGSPSSPMEQIAVGLDSTIVLGYLSSFVPRDPGPAHSMEIRLLFIAFLYGYRRVGL